MKLKSLISCSLFLILCLMITVIVLSDDQDPIFVSPMTEQIRQVYVEFIEHLIDYFYDINYKQLEKLKEIRKIILKSDMVNVDFYRLLDIEEITVIVENYIANDDGTKTLIETITRTNIETISRSNEAILSDKSAVTFFNYFFPSTGNISQRVSLYIIGAGMKNNQNMRSIVWETNFTIPTYSYNVTINNTKVTGATTQESIIISGEREYIVKKTGQPAMITSVYNVAVNGQLFIELPKITLASFTEVIHKEIFLAYRGITRGYHIRLSIP